MRGEPRAYRYVIAGVLFLFLLLSDWVVLNGPLLAVRRGLLVALALAAVPHAAPPPPRRGPRRARVAAGLLRRVPRGRPGGRPLRPGARERSRSHPGLRRGDALRGRGRPDGVAPGDAGPVAAGARAQARRVAAARSRRPVGGSSHHGSGRWNARGAARLRRPVRQPQPARRGGRRLSAARRLPRHRATPAVACWGPAGGSRRVGTPSRFRSRPTCCGRASPAAPGSDWRSSGVAVGAASLWRAFATSLSGAAASPWSSAARWLPLVATVALLLWLDASRGRRRGHGWPCPPHREPIASGDILDAAERPAFWDFAVTKIRQRPWTGYGMSSTPVVFPAARWVLQRNTRTTSSSRPPSTPASLQRS